MSDRDQPRVVASSGSHHPGPGWIALALGVALALIVGVLLGRATAPGGSSPSRSAPTNSEGATRSVAGVPVGYPHTEAGAVAALLNYGVVLDNPQVLLNAARRKQVLAVVATSHYASTFEGAGAAALATVRSGPIGQGLQAGAQTVFMASPIAYRVQSYTPAAAVVQGWGVSVVGNDQGVAPQATWGSTTTTARWVDGDWKIDSVSSTNGPVPALAESEHPSGAGEFLSDLNGFQQPHDVP
jgi:hypothetical protein